MNGCRLTALCHELSLEFQRDIKGPRVASMLADFATCDANWRHFAFFDEECYTRNLVFKDDTYELLLLCWGEGQESPIHNHMGQNCWMAILDGHIEEVQYHQQPGDAPGPLIQKGARVCTPGQVAYISDDIGLHLVRPTGGAGVSLHLYSRPYDLCKVYDPRTGEACDKVLAYHSVHGVRCEGPGTIPSADAHGSACPDPVAGVSAASDPLDRAPRRG